MTTYKLLDTGFVSVSTTRTSQIQLSDVNRAGYTGSAVSALTLKNAGIVRTSNSNTDAKSLANTTTISPTSLVSVQNPVYKFSMVLKKEDTTSGWNYNELIQLTRMETTHGIKLLYVSTGETVSGYYNLIEVMGRKNIGGNFSSATSSEDGGTVSSTTPYLAGRVKNLSISDSPDGTYWRISFDFEESG